MSHLTSEQREWIANTIADAFMPYGREFDPEDGARLLEARMATLLARERERIAEAIEASIPADSHTSNYAATVAAGKRLAAMIARQEPTA